MLYIYYFFLALLQFFLSSCNAAPAVAADRKLFYFDALRMPLFCAGLAFCPKNAENGPFCQRADI